MDKFKIFIRNETIRGYLLQLILIFAVVISFLILFENTANNLREQNQTVSANFLFEAAQFRVGFSPIIEFQMGVSTYGDILLIAILNTLLVSLVAIVSTVFFGVIIGILRLSDNWLVRRIAIIYIEIFRNTPLLLQLIFWYAIFFLPWLPSIKNAINILDIIVIHKSGVNIPSYYISNFSNLILVFVLMVVALFSCYKFIKYARKKQDIEGKYIPALPISIASFIVLFILLSYIFNPIEFIPLEFNKFSFNGFNIPLPFLVLWFGLTVYTSAFIAEAVRGGVLSVDKGQTEAATALGLPKNRIFNLIVLPQALRVIIPPSISQFIGIIKNSSLATAISFEEIVMLFSGITLNTTGQALIIMGMTFLIYQIMSLITSVILNWYNHKSQIVER